MEIGPQHDRRLPLVEITVSYELDARTVPHLHELLADAVRLRPRRLVIDLEQCAALDAAAIAVLLDVHRTVWADGGLVTLRGPSPRLRRMLELAGVHRVFDLLPADEQPRRVSG